MLARAQYQTGTYRMYFTSRELEAAMSKGEMDRWDEARYYFVPMVVGGGLSNAVWLLRPRYGDNPEPLVSFGILLLHVLAGIVVYHGVRKCFRSNEEMDGRDFISRMVVLGFPVLVKIVPFAMVAIMALIHISIRAFPGVHPHLLVSTLAPILNYFTFLLLDRSLRRFSQLRGQFLEQSR